MKPMASPPSTSRIGYGVRTIGAGASSAMPDTRSASRTSESWAVTVTARIVEALRCRARPIRVERRRESRLRSDIRSLDDGHVLCLGALLTLDALELDLRALGERLEAVAGDCAVVEQQVLTACVRGNEAIPLRIVEPLDGSGCHLCNTSSALIKNGQRERHSAHLGTRSRAPTTLAAGKR